MCGLVGGGDSSVAVGGLGECMVGGCMVGVAEEHSTADEGDSRGVAHTTAGDSPCLSVCVDKLELWTAAGVAFSVEECVSTLAVSSVAHLGGFLSCCTGRRPRHGGGGARGGWHWHVPLPHSFAS